MLRVCRNVTICASALGIGIVFAGCAESTPPKPVDTGSSSSASSTSSGEAGTGGIGAMGGMGGMGGAGGN